MATRPLQRPRVLAACARTDFSLLVLFENGQLRSMDMAPLLNTLPFQALHDPTLFCKARVSDGTVVWPRHVEIPPEILYEQSVPAPHPLDDLRTRYPLIFRPRLPRAPGPFKYYGFELFGDGWRPQIQRICALLEAEATRCREHRRPLPWVAVCDERHGQLRLAWGTALNEDLRQQITAICAETGSICAVCGRPGRPSAPVFGMTRCQTHSPQVQTKRSGRTGKVAQP